MPNAIGFSGKETEIGGVDRQEMIGESKICAVVAAESAAAMWRQLNRALAETKTIELRLDWLANDGEIERFLARLAANGPGEAGCAAQAHI